MSLVYDADAEGFLRWAPLLWAPLGAELTKAGAPRPGERVLDACSDQEGRHHLHAQYEAMGTVRPELTPPVRAVTHRVTLAPQTAWAFVTGTGPRSLLLDLEQGRQLVADSLIGTGHRRRPATTGRTEPR